MGGYGSAPNMVSGYGPNTGAVGYGPGGADYGRSNDYGRNSDFGSRSDYGNCSLYFSSFKFKLL